MRPGLSGAALITNNFHTPLFHKPRVKPGLFWFFGGGRLLLNTNKPCVVKLTDIYKMYKCKMLKEFHLGCIADEYERKNKYIFYLLE